MQLCLLCVAPRVCQLAPLCACTLTVLASDARTRAAPLLECLDTRGAQAEGCWGKIAGEWSGLCKARNTAPAPVALTACCSTSAGDAEGPYAVGALKGAERCCREALARSGSAARGARSARRRGCMSRELPRCVQPGQPGACARRARLLRDARCVMPGTSAWLLWLHASHGTRGAGQLAHRLSTLSSGTRQQRSAPSKASMV